VKNGNRTFALVSVLTDLLSIAADRNPDFYELDAGSLRSAQLMLGWLGWIYPMIPIPPYRMKMGLHDKPVAYLRAGSERPSHTDRVRAPASDSEPLRSSPYGPITVAEMDAPMRARLRVDKRGQITAWLGGDNRWHDATELFRQPRGKRRKTDEERLADNARHLAIPATGKFPERSSYVERGGKGVDHGRNRAAHWVPAMAGYCDQRRREIDLALASLPVEHGRNAIRRKQGELGAGRRA
jgi:hypothetical protein